MRIYYKCVLYEDIDELEVPTDKAKLIANKLDNIGISKFEMVYVLPPEPPANEPDAEVESEPPQEEL